MNVLFITRKYPPMVGGMEKQNYELITNLSSLVNKSLIALKKSQINLIWFLPYALIKSIFTITTKKTDDVEDAFDQLFNQ